MLPNPQKLTAADVWQRQYVESLGDGCVSVLKLLLKAKAYDVTKPKNLSAADVWQRQHVESLGDLCLKLYLQGIVT